MDGLQMAIFHGENQACFAKHSGGHLPRLVFWQRITSCFKHLRSGRIQRFVNQRAQPSRADLNAASGELGLQ